MTFVATQLQSRLRSLLGLRGAPLVETIEAIQPVVSLAEFAAPRQPQLEYADSIPRWWTGGDTINAVVAEFGQVGVRTTDPNTILLVTRIVVPNLVAGTKSVTVQLAPNTEALFTQNGICRFSDTRYAGVDLAGSPVEIGGDSAAAVVTAQGRLRFVIPTTQTLILENCNYVLTSRRENDPTPALETLVVQDLNSNETHSAWFEGLLFTWEPPQ